MHDWTRVRIPDCHGSPGFFCLRQKKPGLRRGISLLLMSWFLCFTFVMTQWSSLVISAGHSPPSARSFLPVPQASWFSSGSAALSWCARQRTNWSKVSLQVAIILLLLYSRLREMVVSRCVVHDKGSWNSCPLINPWKGWENRSPDWAKRGGTPNLPD